MTARLGAIVVDTVDPGAVAEFWHHLLGGELGDGADGDTVLTAPGAELRFRTCTEAKTVKNRVHPDLYVAAVEPLVELGAVVLAELPDWVTLADIEGNEFCAFRDPAGTGAGAAARLFSLCTDSAQPEELAAWWAAQLGTRVEPGPDGTPRWLQGPPGWPELIWKFVRAPDARVAPNRWRWTVRAGPDERRTDPQGNEFELY